MTYVPTPVYVPPPHASLEARELGGRIAEAIRDYQQDHPRMADADVQQALRIAQMQTGVGGAKRVMVLLVGLTLALVLFTLGVVMFMNRGP